MRGSAVVSVCLSAFCSLGLGLLGCMSVAIAFALLCSARLGFALLCSALLCSALLCLGLELASECLAQLSFCFALALTTLHVLSVALLLPLLRVCPSVLPYPFLLFPSLLLEREREQERVVLLENSRHILFRACIYLPIYLAFFAQGEQQHAFVGWNACFCCLMDLIQ